MTTVIETYSAESVSEASELLKRGELVAIPTETVYGLAANALNENAVRKIFKAKGRPQDNPLIVHIAEPDMLPPLVREIPDVAKRLVERFWAGPLTMIFPKSDKIPDVTSGGLDTVAVRMPASEAALSIIRQCGFPLAAPSANTSGMPSPTTARHVFEDMNGKIPLIIDGGECSVGVESTVICFKNDKIHILRPGGVTAEMLAEFGGVEVDKAVTSQPENDEKVLSPGMKYKHYSPKAEVYIVNARGEEFREYCRKRAQYDKGLIALGAGVPEEGIFLNCGNAPEEQAQRLFALLRRADELGAKTVLVEMPDTSGVGLAVFNRLLRAAAFRIIEVEECLLSDNSSNG